MRKGKEGGKHKGGERKREVVGRGQSERELLVSVKGWLVSRCKLSFLPVARLAAGQGCCC